MPGGVSIVGVASPYAWDVVETLLRLGRRPVCVDNFGGADERLPGLDENPNLRSDHVLGLSSGVHRATAARAAHAAGFHTPIAVVDPTAAVARTVLAGHGAYVNAGAVVGSHATVGCHANVNRSVSIGHDNDIGFAAAFGPGAVTTGDVKIGPAAFIGAGATILPGRRIGRRAVVGAGAVVTKDVAAGEVVVGNPARVVRTVDLAHHLEEDDRCPHC